MEPATRSESFTLRPYQEEARRAIHAGFREFDRQLAVMPTGCHAPGHPILMADGTAAPVESIRVGDRVMGPDSLPRTVLELHSGIDEMFRITPKKGEPFVVNGGHVLSLARTRPGCPSSDKRPWTTEITVKQWLDQTSHFRRLHKLWRVPIERSPARRQIKNVLVTGFDVEPVGRGPYHGFTLDGDHLYVDGSFTVHHNSGKTILFSALASDLQPRRTLILAHREELITQAADKLRRSTGINAEVERADERASLDAPVVVGSVQTLMQTERRARWPRDHFGLVVADEVHRAMSDSWQTVLRHFDDHAQIIGVSATPERSDKRHLGQYFQNIAYEIGLLDLIRAGWLSPIRVKTVPLGIDLRGVRTTAGDYNADDLGHALDPWLERIADVFVEHQDRKMIVFLPLIAVSERLAGLCRDRGLAAEHVDGQSRDRKEILDRFRRDETRLLTNAMLLSEGFDEPSIDCVVCLRPTKVRSLFAQAVGRGTRIFPGKDHLLILDFLWQYEEHSLVKPAHLIAEDAEDAAAITEKLGDEGDLEEAKEEVEADRTRKLQERLARNRHRRSMVLDPLELAVALNDAHLAEFVPTMRWHEDPPTPKQIQTLRKFGLGTSGVTCKGHASLLLDRLFTRRQLNLATPKQVRALKRLGYEDAEMIKFNDAGAILSVHFGNATPALS